MPRKIIIDTDPGIDDAMAIFYALKSPELELIGLTTIFGNVYVDLATTNALRLLEIADRPDIPVARGADNPLEGAFSNPPVFVHGEDGQGNVHLPPPKTQAIKQTAAEFIVEQVMSAPGEITLVPVGPLTNIGLALQIEPRIAQNVREVVLMGGNALGPGNATPAAEANIYHDALAADMVFGAEWPVTMVGLDVTYKVIMTTDQLKHYEQTNTPMAQHIARIVPLYRDLYQQRAGIDGIFVHDSTTISYLLDPSLFKTAQWPMRVDFSDGIGHGKTWPALYDWRILPPWQGRPKVNVCLEVNGPACVELELSRMCP